MKRTALKRTSLLRPVSAKRAKQSRIYTAKRMAYLAAHPYCEWFIEQGTTPEKEVIATGVAVIALTGHRVVVPHSVEIHHRAGRSGANYLDEKTWMAVSRIGHEWIHRNPKEARARGWILTGRAAR